MDKFRKHYLQIIRFCQYNTIYYQIRVKKEERLTSLCGVRSLKKPIYVIPLDFDLFKKEQIPYKKNL